METSIYGADLLREVSQALRTEAEFRTKLTFDSFRVLLSSQLLA